MNKSEVCETIASRTSIPTSTVWRVIDQFEDVVTQALREGNVVLLKGFVKFESVQKPARDSRNPRTGDPIVVPPKRHAKIRPMAGLRRAVNS